jgi:hypothetical protein
MVKIYDKRNNNQSYGFRDQGITLRNLYRTLGIRHSCHLEVVHRALKEDPALALSKMQMVHAENRWRRKIRVKTGAAGNHLCHLLEKEIL